MNPKAGIIMSVKRLETVFRIIKALYKSKILLLLVASSQFSTLLEESRIY